MSDGDVCVICWDDVALDTATRIACETCSAVFHARCLVQFALHRSLASPDGRLSAIGAVAYIRSCTIPVHCVVPGHEIGLASSHTIELAPGNLEPLWRVIARRAREHVAHIYITLVLMWIWYTSSAGLRADSTELALFAILSAPVLLFVRADRESSKFLIDTIVDTILRWTCCLFMYRISQVQLGAYAVHVCQANSRSELGFAWLCYRITYIVLILTRIVFTMRVAHVVKTVMSMFRSTTALTQVLVRFMASSIVVASLFDAALGTGVAILFLVIVYALVLAYTITFNLLIVPYFILCESDNTTVCRYSNKTTCVSLEYNARISIATKSAVMVE